MGTRYAGFSIILAGGLAALSPLAFAQQHLENNAQGITNISGAYTYQMGTVGAMANRKSADDLYKKSLQDESNAWSTFPPNVGLLAQSLQEAKNGLKADDQAHSLAQSSLNAVNSGTKSGNFDTSNYDSISTDALKNLVNTSSPYYPQVSAKLTSYGMNLSEDKQYMSTPFGKFPVGMSSDDLSATMSKIAVTMGYSAADIAKGSDAAAANSEAISQKALADVQASAKAKALADAEKGKDGADAAASDNSRMDGKTASLEDALNSANAQAAAELAARAAAAKDLKNSLPPGYDLAGGNSNIDDWDAKARALNDNRGELLRKMGLEPIHEKGEDLFAVVHARYVHLDEQNSFLGPLAPAIVTQRLPASVSASPGQVSSASLSHPNNPTNW